MEVVINYDNLESFCDKNGFIIVSLPELVKENIYLDLKYATNNNFTGHRVYPVNMPLIINKKIWEKVKKVNDVLKKDNLCLLILDAYRPVLVQKIFWDYYALEKNNVNELLVANPNKYGTHNITMHAIDLMPVNLDGSLIELPSCFDDFSGKANIYYEGCSTLAKTNRDNFLQIVTSCGFIVNEEEWWHFYDDSLKDYGMSYNYKDSEYKPIDEDLVFKIDK